MQKKLFMLTTFLIMLTTFAYSALATNLSITGEANIRAVSDIRVTNIELDNAKNGGVLSYEPKYTKDTITNGFVLPNTNSEISYNVTIKNKGTIDQAIYNLQTLSSNNNNMIILIDGEEINEALPIVVPFGTSRTIKITYKTTSPSNSVINIKNKFVFKEVYYITYNTKGGSSVAQQIKYEDVDLTLEGTPTKSKYVFTGWTDEQNGTTVKYNVGSTYTLNEDKTMYAIWRTGEATFLSGNQFAVKIKRLAGDTLNQDYPYLTDDANITSIVRANALPQGFTPTEANIVSTQDSDFPIYAWYDNHTLYYYTVVDNPYMNQVANNMFRGLTKVKNIDLSTINTSRTQSMHAMFMSCMELTTLDLSNFDTRNVGGSVYVEAMTHLFHDCRKLTSITFGNNFVTDNVFSMNEMFEDCQKLKSLNLSNFNTSKVTNMSSLFNHCYELETITLGNNFTTSNVTTMYAMFNHNYKLTSINLSNFNTSKVTNMKYMFNGCGLLTSLDLSTFVTNNVTDMSYMFSGCNSIQSLDLSTFDMNKVTTIEYILTNNMTALRQLKTPKVYPSNLNISLYKTFYDPSNNAYTTLATGNPTQTWIKLPYTVKFNANNGTGTMADQKIGVDATTTLSTNTFTREGYTFAGWNTSQDGTGTAYLNNASVTNLGTYNDEITLYAQWLGIDYTLTADANGGSIPSTTGWTGTGNTSTKTVTYDSTYGTLPTPTRTGYTFKGWSNTIDSNLPSNYKKLNYIESTGTQYIDTGYIPKTTTKIELDLSFNGDFKNVNDYGGIGQFLGVYDSNSKLFSINFGGGSNESNRIYPWFNKMYQYDGQAEESFYISNDIRENRNKLTIENGRVSYSTRGRTISNKEQNQDSSMYLFGKNSKIQSISSGAFTSYNMRVYEMKVYENNVLVRHYIPVLNTTNHKLGLYETENQEFYSNIGTGEFNTEYITNNTNNTTSSNHTIYAIWQPNTYNIVFDKNDNDAIGTMSNQTVDYDKTVNLNANTYIKEGYTFAGWNTQANGQGTAYLDEASVSNLTSTNNGNVTLYAQWIANQYTATFDYNGNLLYGLDNKSETTSYHIKYSINNGNISVTALTDDGNGYTTGRVYLEANKTYIFNCSTDAEFGTSTGDSQQAFLMLNGEYPGTNYHMLSKNNYEFTPTVSGTYWLRLDVNQNGQTHTFSNISIKEKNTTKQVTYDQAYGTLPTPTERPGYVFKGWNGKNNVNLNKVVLQNATISNNKVIFDASHITGNGASGINIQIYYTDSTLVEINTSNTSSTGMAYLSFTPTKDISQVQIHMNTWKQDGRLIIINNDILETNKTYIISYNIESIDLSTAQATISNIQLEEGTSYTTYEPYYVTSSINVTQAKNHTLKAIWEKKEATFDTGEIFNVKIKTLAGNNDPTYSSIDENITSIQRSNNVPQSWIGQDGTITPPSDDNIVSTNESSYPIYAWYDNGTIYYYTEALNPYMNNNAFVMFYRLKYVTTIDINTINTSKTLNMRSLFDGCYSLQNLDLSNFSTSNVNNMGYMFVGTKFTKLDLTLFNTNNVVDMKCMFSNMYYLTTLDLSTFNMSKVTTVTDMLNNIASLKQLKTPNTIPSGITITLPKMMIDSSGNEYTQLTSTTPTNTWLYTPATFISGNDFNIKIKQLANPNDTVSSSSYVDETITSIQRYTNTPSSSTLENAEVISTDDSYKPIYVWYDNGIIYYYTEATSLYTNNNAASMFRGLKNVSAIDLSTIKTSKTQFMNAMFYQDYNLRIIDVSNFNTSNVTNMSDMFSMYLGTSILEEIRGLTSFNTSNVTNMSTIFYNCQKIATLDLSSFDMTNVGGTVLNLFYYMNLTSLKTPSVIPSGVTINLPNTLYDTSGNSYSTLTSTSPTSTWLKTEYAPYNITYDLDGGTLSSSNPATYTKGSNNITLNNPTKEGYNFVGWSGGKNLLNVNLEEGVPSNTSFESTASRTFNVDTYVKGIAYNNYYQPLNVGSVVINSNSITLNSKSGYGIGYPIISEPNKTYTISYTATTDNSDPMVSVLYYKQNGEYISYTANWNGAGNKKITFTTPANTYYIVIAFTVNNQVSNVTFSNIQLEEGTTSTTYESYVSEQSTITIPTGSVGNRTYKANWLGNEYSVIFDKNDNNATGTMNNQTLRYGQSGNLNANTYLNNGYTFAGWNTASDGSGTAYLDEASVSNLTSTSNGSVTLYAQWIVAYTVIFDKNDNNAIGTMNNQPFVYGISQNLNANTYTKTGYTFAGWNTSADGSGTAYLDEASVSNLTSTNNGSVTLYAQWIANQYTVTFDYNGNLLYGLDNKAETTSQFMKYKINNGTITVTSTRDDGYGFTTGRVYLEANKTYIFNCDTNGTWGYSNDTVEVYLALDGQYNKYYRMHSNSNYEFTPDTSGTYYLRLDVNKNDETHTFSNVIIKEKNTTKQVTYDSTYGTLPTPTERPGYVFKGWNGKNLFDETKYYELTDYNMTNNGTYYYTDIQLKPNTNYKVSIKRYNNFSGTNNGYLLISTLNQNGTFNDSNNWTSIAHSNNPNGSAAGFSYTTDSTGKLYIGRYNVTQSNLDTIWENTDVQIEEGTTSTTYEPYYVISSTNVTQSKNHTLKAMWEKKEATFVGGESFNIKIKTLAGNNNPTSISENTNITSIVRATNVPQSWIGQDGTITAPSDNNIVSTNTSQYPIYAWFNNGTVYYYTEALNPSVTNTYRMFRGLVNVVTIDIRDIDTSKATGLSAMFMDCSSLINLDLSNFKTSNVDSTAYMFYNSGLKTLDLSSFDMSVANPASMLNNMTSLQSLKTPNTYYYGNSNVTITLPRLMIDSSGNEYTQLTSTSPTSTWLYTPTTFITGEQFNVVIKQLAGNQGAIISTDDTNITSIQRYTNTPSSSTLENAEIVSTSDSYKKIYAWYDNGIIYYYSESANIYLNKSSNLMFNRLRNLETLNIASINTNLNMTTNTNYYGMFQYCNSLTSLDLSNFNMSNINNSVYFDSMLYELTSLKQLKTPNTYPSDTSVTITLPKLMLDSSGNEYTQLTSTAPTSTWLYTPATFKNAYDFNAAIKQLANPSEIVNNYDFTDTNITSIQRANSVPSSWIVNNVITPPSNNNIVSTDDSYKPIYAWFDNGTIYYYTEATNPYMNKIGNYMFSRLRNVSSIELDTIKTSFTTEMIMIFNSTVNLSQLNLSNFNTNSVTKMTSMFQSSGIVSLNINNFNTENVTSMQNMFNYCTNLESLDLSTFNLTNVTNTTNMFSGMSSLTSLKTPNIIPSGITINLPTALYDASGNSYSTLTSTSPTNTWLSPQYTITYDLDGGTVSTPNPTTYTKGSSSITLNNPTKSGYTFKGWSGGKNLFNINDVVDEYYLDSNGVPDPDTPQWSYSNYIEIQGGKTYTFNPNSSNGGAAYHIIYDAEKNFLNSFPSGPRTITMPQNAKFIRVSYRKYSYSIYEGSTNIQLEEGTTSTSYEPYINEQTTVTIPSGSTGNRTYKAIWEENTPTPQNNQNQLQSNNTLNSNKKSLKTDSNKLESNSEEETNSNDLTANINKFNIDKIINKNILSLIYNSIITSILN